MFHILDMETCTGFALSTVKAYGSNGGHFHLSPDKNN